MRLHPFTLRSGSALIAMIAAALLTTPTLGQGITSVAAEIGITPESTVIADWDTQTASLILSRIEAEVGLRQALEVAHQAVDAAASTVTELAQVLLNEPNNQQHLQQYEAAVAAQEAVGQQMVVLRDLLFDAAVQGLQQPKIDAVVIWRYGALRRVEPSFRTHQRTLEQWKAIERALRAEKRALRLGEELDEDEAQLLANVRSDPLVTQAAIQLQIDLEIMTQTFELYEN